MEDGILTDGKGRTVNFKNCILVMTSNVGSKRILEVASKAAPASYTSSLAEAPAPTPAVDPLRPDEVMTRLQKNPEAMAMMMEAASDPDLMRAMQTAMGGSPADLLRLGQNNEKVADFLRRLWRILNETEGEASLSTNDKYTYPSPVPEEKKQSNPLLENDFANGIIKQFQSMMDPNKNEPTAEQGVRKEIAANSSTSSIDAVSTPSTSTNNAEESSQYAEMSKVVKEELGNTMKPELLNRIDEIVIFSPLGGNELKSVASLLMQGTIKRAREERGIDLSVSPNLIEQVIAEGASSAAQFGARPMRRAVQRYFEDTVSDAIVRGFLKEGDMATVDINDPLSAIITNTSNNSSIRINIEDTSAGIGTELLARPTVNGDATDELQTQPL